MTDMRSYQHIPSEQQDYKTKDYGIFTRVKVNRPFRPEKVDELVKAIQLDNQLDINPIVVNEKGEIMAGQHRHAAAERLGVWLYYKIKDLTILQAAEMDNNTDGWEMSDYLHMRVQLGNPEYIALDHFYKEFPWLSLSTAAALCSSITHGSDFHPIFNTGGYKADQVDYARHIVDLLLDFKPYCNFYKTKSFIAAIRGLDKDSNYRHSRMLKKLKIRSVLLTKAGDVNGYYEVLNKLYNYREPQSHWVKFWRIRPDAGHGPRTPGGQFAPKEDDDTEDE